MATGAPLGLYVHIPYCRRVCPYCDFNVVATAEPPEDAYADGVVAELDAWAREGSLAGRSLATVFFGGGTPSLFRPRAIARLLDAARCGFGLDPDAEVSLEANPGTVSPATLAGYRDAGVNRLSLGAQSFHESHLQTLGRDHGPADTVGAVEAARAAGFDNLSLDLIFAVPGQSVAEWDDDLARAIALAPAHVSAYSLTYEEGTPFHRRRARGELRAVAEDDEAAMAELAEARLEAAGYARYEISSFARPGRGARHNLAYWEGADYLGVGAGAHSFTALPHPGRRWMNERPPGRYLAAVRGRGRAVATEDVLTEAQARGEFAFCGLRQVKGVDLPAFERRFGLALPAAFPQVERLVADGLLEPSGDRLRLTPRGRRHADTVAATFV
jgi:oxygen-independent coproporphyrinogen-3 oxidase